MHYCIEQGDIASDLQRGDVSVAKVAQLVPAGSTTINVGAPS